MSRVVFKKFISKMEVALLHLKSGICCTYVDHRGEEETPFTNLCMLQS